MTCRKCGARLPEEAKFCLNCGTAAPPAGTPNAPKAQSSKGSLLFLAIAVVAVVLVMKAFGGGGDRGGSSYNTPYTPGDPTPPAAGSTDPLPVSASGGQAVLPDLDYFGSRVLEYLTDLNHEDRGFSVVCYTVPEECYSLAEEYADLLKSSGYSVRDNGSEGEDEWWIFDYTGPGTAGTFSLDEPNEQNIAARLDISTANDGEYMVVLKYSNSLKLQDTGDRYSGAVSYKPSTTTPEPEPSAPSVPEPPAPSGAVLPDPSKFFQCARNEDMSSSSFGSNGRIVSVKFDLDDGKDVVGEFIDLLQENRYHLTLRDSKSEDYIKSSACKFDTYYFDYNGSETVGLMHDGSEGPTAPVYVLVGYYYDRGTIGLALYYGDGLTLSDPGDRASTLPRDASGKASSGGGTSSGGGGSYTPDAARLDCLTCDGTGECPKCGGDGYLHSSASDKEDRNCWKCGGDGDCPTCHGTGKR